MTAKQEASKMSQVLQGVKKIAEKKAKKFKTALVYIENGKIVEKHFSKK